MLEICVTSLTNIFKKIASWWQRGNQKKNMDSEDEMEMSIRGVLLLVSILFICSVAGTAVLFTCIEDWSYFEGVYFTIVSFTTVGLGDFVPFREATQHNKYEVYHMLNLFVIIIGSIFTYIFLNLVATLYKCMIHYLANQSSLVVEDRPTTTNKRRVNNNTTPGTDIESRTIPRRKIGITRLNSISSSANGAVESNPMGSFAAIQRAIDRIRNKAVEDNTARTNELKAVNTIEAILQNEYQKIQARQGDTPKARWYRAAAKARLSNRRKNSVYNSVILDTTSIHNGYPPNLDAIIAKRSLQHKSLSTLSSKRLPERTFSNLSTKSLQEMTLQDTLTNHAFSTAATNNNSQQIHPIFNVQGFKESKSKLSITHEDAEDRELTLQNVLNNRIKEKVSRQYAQSTYIPSSTTHHEYGHLQQSHQLHQRMHHLSPSASRENTPGSRRRVEYPSPTDNGGHVYYQNRRFSQNNNNNNNNNNIINIGVGGAGRGIQQHDLDAALTYENIMDNSQDTPPRRRRSTKSTYLSSNSKSRRSSMELDDLATVPLPLVLQHQHQGQSLQQQQQHHQQHLHHETEEGIGDCGITTNNPKMEEHQEGMYYECPITVDHPYYDSEDIEAVEEDTDTRHSEDEHVYGDVDVNGDAINLYDSNMILGESERSGVDLINSTVPYSQPLSTSIMTRHEQETIKTQLYKSYESLKMIGNLV